MSITNFGDGAVLNDRFTFATADLAPVTSSRPHSGSICSATEYACARNGKQGILLSMKVLFLAFVFMSCGLLPVISDDAQLKPGLMAVARDPTGTVLGTDSTQSLNKLMEFARDQDQEAIKQLMREGHVVGIKSGSKETVFAK